jgi:hypothetical protein
VIAYKPSTNEILVIACKSYLDSPGVMLAGFMGKKIATKDVYKLFNRARLREGSARNADRATPSRRPACPLRARGARSVVANGWSTRKMSPKCGRSLQRKDGPSSDRAKVAFGLRAFADRGYENDVVTFVTKILERNR